MDMQDHTVEIKQEVRTHNEIVDITHIKSEQTYPNFGVQCDSIEDEEVKVNNQDESESVIPIHEYIFMEVKEEDACNAAIEKMNENSVDTDPSQLTEESDSNIKSSMSISAIYDVVLHRMKVEAGEVDHGKTGALSAVDVKSENLPEKPGEVYMYSTELEDMDTLQPNEDFKIKSEIYPSSTCDSVLESAPKKKQCRTELQVVHMQAERKLFFCYNCNYTACSKMRLVQHISVGECNTITNLDKSQITRPLNVYVCTQCNKVFKKKKTLDDHVIKKHIELITSLSSKIHKCTECNYKTTDEFNLRKHMLIHSGAVSELIKCQHCNTLLKSRQILDNHIVRKHPDFIESIKRKIHECSQCTYKTIFKPSFKRHLLIHSDIGSSSKEQVLHTESNTELFVCYNCNYTAQSKTDLIQHISVGKCYLNTDLSESPFANTGQHPWDAHACTQCSMVFKKKTSLHDHVIKKHKDSVASVSSKIHECTYCNYKTTKKTNITRHMVIHPNAVSKLSKCKYCNASFNSGEILDNHILKKHPAFIASIERKILECSYCPYKTIIKHYYNEHMRVHFRGERSICKHCEASFISKRYLDAHIVKQHPEFIASVTSKIHQCSYCTYKTTHKCHFDAHLLIHSFGKPPTCEHCASTFKSKQLLDNHILKKHPDFSASVSSKVHSCSNCDYKSTKKSNFDRHVLKHLDTYSPNLITCQHCNVKFEGRQILNKHMMEKHPGLATSVKITACKHCTMTFNSKYDLDDHIVKKHQEFIASVTRKIYECPYCTYKTVRTSKSKKHILSHRRQGQLNQAQVKQEQNADST